MTAVEFLSGDRVYLRPLLETDSAGAYPDWLNDEAASRGNSHHAFPYTETAAMGYIRAAATAQDALVLAIVVREGQRHIGNIALQGIRMIDRAAEFAILIGDRDAWGKGFGTEAARLICDYGFRTLNLHRISCGTFDDNAAMRRLAVALGMREEGRRREAVYKAGRFVDLVEYGVLRHEYMIGRDRSAHASDRPGLGSTG